MADGKDMDMDKDKEDVQIVEAAADQIAPVKDKEVAEVAGKKEAWPDPEWLVHYIKMQPDGPQREMPGSEEMEFTLKEEDVGIAHYVNKDVAGFGGILKHRYSDFSVNEIDLKGNVVRMTSASTEVPKDKTEGAEKAMTPEDWPKYAELPEADRAAVSSLQWIRITEMAKKYLGGAKPTEAEQVTIDVTEKEKSARKRIHDIVKKFFPHLASDTRELEAKKQVRD
jgi:hypothetical protein